jgi:hypothetical protein
MGEEGMGSIGCDVVLDAGHSSDSTSADDAAGMKAAVVRDGLLSAASSL